MLDDFLIRACIAGIGVVLAAGPLGCFVVWRRIAYFGDATAHAAILGVALSLALSISIVAGVLLVAVAMAIAVSTLSGRGLEMDTLLGVVSHAGLAIGVVAIAVVAPYSVDLKAYLFGELLTVTRTDLAVIAGGVALVLGLLIWRWSALLIATLSPELAWGAGIVPRKEQLILTVALDVLVAVSIKVVGALLITAMLIVPAAAARPLSRTPEIMAVVATGIGITAVLLGMFVYWHWDTPSAPTIVTVAIGLFVVTICANAVRRHER